jgi:hypothetical protein
MFDAEPETSATFEAVEASYRIVFLNRAGKVKRVVPLACDDDEAALEAVEPFDDGSEMEVWCGDRRVWWLQGAM